MSETVSSVVDLGFATARVPRGAHICQIYVNKDERDDALRKFVAKGLLAQESTACFSDNIDIEDLGSWFERLGLSLDDERNSGRFVQSGAESVYFQNGCFDPDRMLGLLTQFHQESLDHHRAGARVIGEMSSNILRIEGGSRLFEYEARVNRLLCEHPVTAVCQYNAREFDGATIMDVLTVHPMMVLRGTVVQNPLYVPPEAFARP